MTGPKLIYLARRNPLLTRTAFTPRWRQHGALGMSLPRWKNIERYAHCDTLPEALGTPGMADDYDGVGIVWHRSPAHRLAHREDTSSQAIMERDEAETFSEPVANFCALYEEKLILDHDLTGGIKLIRFLRCRPDFPLGNFRGDWANECRDLVLDVVGTAHAVRKYVQNHIMPPERPGGWGLNYHIVEELWFDNLDQALQAQRALAACAPLASAFERAVAKVTSVMTNEVVLYEAATAS